MLGHPPPSPSLKGQKCVRGVGVKGCTWAAPMNWFKAVGGVGGFTCQAGPIKPTPTPNDEEQPTWERYV